MLGLTTAIAMELTAAAVTAAPKIIPKIRQYAPAVLNQVNKLRPKLQATLEKMSPQANALQPEAQAVVTETLQIAPQAMKLAKGLAQVTGFTITFNLAGCGGGGGDAPPQVISPPPPSNPPPNNPPPNNPPPQCVCTGEATLTWDPGVSQATGQVDGDLAGFKIYVGDSSGTYVTDVPFTVNNNANLVTSPATLGNVTTVTIKNLRVGGVTHYFAVSAYDSAGNESPVSAEVSKAF